MPLPSAVTLGSVAFVVAAGVGLATVSSSADDSADPDTATAARSHAPPSTKPTATKPTATKPATPQHRAKPDKNKRGNQRPDDGVPKAFVEVYNNSGISGLAAETSAQLQNAGWNVAATDNWYGEIPENTVYYPADLKKEARELADVLDISRTMPAVSPMQFDRLTVILTSAS